MTLHDIRFAGEAAETKLSTIRPEIANSNADALVVSDPHAVAWAFNIRGADVSHTPLPLSFAIIPREGRPSLFIDGRKLGNDVRHRLEELADVRAPGDFANELSVLSKAGKIVHLDQATAADALARIVRGAGAKVAKGPDPIALLKAVKNPVEIEGAREAHRRDGAAMARFLAWFDREASKGQLTEIGAVEALETFRRETNLLRDVSFSTIAGAGPDGAIVHYRVTRKTDRAIKPNELFLIDSGGQYQDGTTDMTRTVASASRPRKCATASRACSKATSPSRRRCFRTAPPARSSIPSRGNRSGRPASTSTTAPAMASAAICRCMKDRRGSPSSGPRRSSAA